MGEEGSMTDAERAELIVSQTVLEKPFARGLSYVEPRDTQSFCFTGHYGKVLHKSSGSMFHLPSDGGVPLDRNNPATVFGAVRFFAPKEILNLLGFQKPFTLPKEMHLKHRYKVVGNSIAVTVCSELLRLLLLGRDDVNLGLLEQAHPPRSDLSGEYVVLSVAEAGVAVDEDAD